MKLMNCYNVSSFVQYLLSSDTKRHVSSHFPLFNCHGILHGNNIFHGHFDAKYVWAKFSKYSIFKVNFYAIQWCISRRKIKQNILQNNRGNHKRIVRHSINQSMSCVLIELIISKYRMSSNANYFKLFVLVPTKCFACGHHMIAAKRPFWYNCVATLSTKLDTWLARISRKNITYMYIPRIPVYNITYRFRFISRGVCD